MHTLALASAGLPIALAFGEQKFWATKCDADERSWALSCSCSTEGARANCSLLLRFEGSTNGVCAARMAFSGGVGSAVDAVQMEVGCKRAALYWS